MSRFVDDGFVLGDGSAIPPRYLGALYRDLDVDRAPEEDQRAAVEAWLEAGNRPDGWLLEHQLVSAGYRIPD